MALIDCKECKKEVSDLARACPNCGAPVKNNIVDDISAVTTKVKSKISKSSFNDEATGKLKLVAGVIYALHLLTLFLYIFPFVISIVFTKIKAKQAKNTWLESHFDFHMRTIMVSIWIVVIASAMIIVLVLFESDSSGLKILLFTPYLPFPWLLYRGIKGGFALFENREITSKAAS